MGSQPIRIQPRKILQENLAGKSCRKILREIFLEILREILLDILQEILWDILQKILQEILWEILREIPHTYPQAIFEGNFQNMQFI